MLTFRSDADDEEIATRHSTTRVPGHVRSKSHGRLDGIPIETSYVWRMSSTIRRNSILCMTVTGFCVVYPYGV